MSWAAWAPPCASGRSSDPSPGTNRKPRTAEMEMGKPGFTLSLLWLSHLHHLPASSPCPAFCSQLCPLPAAQPPESCPGCDGSQRALGASSGSMETGPGTRDSQAHATQPTTAQHEPCLAGNHRKGPKIHSRVPHHRHVPLYRWENETQETGSDLPKFPGQTTTGLRLNPGLPGEATSGLWFLMTPPPG